MSKTRSVRNSHADARSTILSVLIEAGASGVLSSDLIEICQRAQARISELRADGYAIRSRRERSSGLARYILTDARRVEKPQLIAGFKVRVTDDGNVEVSAYDDTREDLLSKKQQEALCVLLRGVVAQKMSVMTAIDFAA